jgi:hypothetical protein
MLLRSVLQCSMLLPSRWNQNAIDPATHISQIRAFICHKFYDPQTTRPGQPQPKLTNVSYATNFVLKAPREQSAKQKPPVISPTVIRNLRVKKFRLISSFGSQTIRGMYRQRLQWSSGWGELSVIEESRVRAAVLAFFGAVTETCMLFRLRNFG